MRKIYCIISLIVVLSCGMEQKGVPPRISQPVTIEDDDWKFEGTQNMIFVPENRNDPKSRLLSLQFFHFPAKEKSNLPPVVFLGAGPGEPYDIAAFYNGLRAEAWRYELNFVNQKRDVILINQRGNSDAPGLQINNFSYKWNNGGSLDKPFDLEVRDKNRSESYAKYIEEYQKRGIDLKGYDIIHFVDDIEAVRKEVGAEKLALVGNSFASQWALGYIQRYPERVDRALFSGVEPLDHNYDDPDGTWAVLEKISAYAQKDSSISKHLPPGGLMEAFTSVLATLEKQPQKVQVQTKDGDMLEIVVGADDLRYSLTFPRVRSYVAEIESWPKYIMEMYQGDFRMLGVLSRGRIYNSSARMIDPLFNNSLGISRQREALLNNRESKKWLGNLARHYTATRGICPSPVVPDSFRKHTKHSIPVVLIQGDMDLSTPYENATFLMNHLENGYLLTVKRGFHNAKRALIFADSTLMNRVYNFMDLDFEVDDFKEFRLTLPQEHAMSEFNFWSLEGESLYERYITGND